MSLCDSLQVIGHCGLRTKIEERKRSRWENVILMLKPFIFFLGVQIWYLETDVKAKLAFIFRYAGKDKLFYDLNSASYITKIRRKQCRWDPSSCFQLWTVVCIQPVATGQATSWPASSLPLQLQFHNLGSRCLQVGGSSDHCPIATQGHRLAVLVWRLHCSCSALNPFYSGSPPPSPAWSSWASARTRCWQTPPFPQLPGDTLKSLRLRMKYSQCRNLTELASIDVNGCTKWVHIFTSVPANPGFSLLLPLITAFACVPVNPWSS